MDADKKIRITISFPEYVSFSSIDLTCGTDPSYKVKKSHSNVHEAEQSCSEYPHQKQNAGYAFRKDGCVWVCGEGALLAVKLCRLLPLSLLLSLPLPPSLSLSLIPSLGPLTCAGLTFLTPLSASSRSIDGSDFTLTQ